MLSKSDLFVQTSFWRCWTWLFFIFPIDAATVHSEVVVDSTGLVQQGRVFATHRNSVSGQQLIRKEGTNATLEHMLKQHTKEPQEHFDLLVIIPATLQRDRSKLQTVRETWAKDIDSKTHLCQRCNSERTVKYLFMLGEEAVEENPQDDDVVVLPRSSSDYVLLAQKVKKSIHYAVTHYSFDLLLKTDTDSWIFLDRLLQFAEENELFDPRRSAQAGDVRRHAQPAPGGKNIDEVFTVLTGQETYPIYSAGPGYLLTRNLCNYISLLVEDDDVNNKTDAKKESLPALTDLPQEDVSVGFWLQAVEHEQVVMPISGWPEGCRRSAGQTLVLDHYVKEAEMRRRWKNLQSSGNPCKAW